jgi:hypothetical protein
MRFKKSTTEILENMKKGYHYCRLSQALQKGYEIVVAGITSFQKKIQIPDVYSKKEIEQIISAVIMEQFHLFYFNPREIRILQTGSLYVFLFEYIYDKKKAEQLFQQIEENANFVLSQIITDDMDDYKKCMAVHDYMTENIRYNFSALSVNYAYDAFTVEGSLIKKQAVCEGIAKGIGYLLDKLKIQNIVVYGSSDIDGQQIGHAWNMMELSGDYYHMDVTWDLQEINHFTNHSHTYFNLDDESMLMNHFWELQDYPRCKSKRENYYVKQKKYFRTFQSFELYVQKFLKENQVYMDVRFEDILEIPDDGGKFLVELVKKNAEYMGKKFQISFVFHPYNYVFQADIVYQ